MDGKSCVAHALHLRVLLTFLSSQPWMIKGCSIRDGNSNLTCWYSLNLTQGWVFLGDSGQEFILAGGNFTVSLVFSLHFNFAIPCSLWFKPNPVSLLHPWGSFIFLRKHVGKGKRGRVVDPFYLFNFLSPFILNPKRGYSPFPSSCLLKFHPNQSLLLKVLIDQFGLFCVK